MSQTTENSSKDQYSPEIKNEITERCGQFGERLFKFISEDEESKKECNILVIGSVLIEMMVYSLKNTKQFNLQDVLQMVRVEWKNSKVGDQDASELDLIQILNMPINIENSEGEVK